LNSEWLYNRISDFCNGELDSLSAISDNTGSLRVLIRVCKLYSPFNFIHIMEGTNRFLRSVPQKKAEPSN